MMNKTKIDINCDLGERHPETGLNSDAELIPYLSSCNICCGFHSSDSLLIEQTVLLALKQGLRIGAHPSYDDKANFGRVQVEDGEDKILSDILYQISALKGMVEYHGGRLHHIKAHGALYHFLGHNLEFANKYVDMAKQFDPSIKIMGMPSTALEAICSQMRLTFIREGFGDRRYSSQNMLVSRKKTNAVINNYTELKEQLDNFLSDTVIDENGNEHNIEIDSLCFHSDSDMVLQNLKWTYSYLIENNISVHA